MRLPIFALALATLAAPAPAFTGQNRMRVTGDGESITVLFFPRAGVTDYWCAAGNYVVRELGLPERTRVYRASPEPRRRGQGIDFSLNPARSTGDTGISTFGATQDGGMTAGSAIARFCYDFDVPTYGLGFSN